MSLSGHQLKISDEEESVGVGGEIWGWCVFHIETRPTAFHNLITISLRGGEARMNPCECILSMDCGVCYNMTIVMANSELHRAELSELI